MTQDSMPCMEEQVADNREKHLVPATESGRLRRAGTDTHLEVVHHRDEGNQFWKHTSQVRGNSIMPDPELGLSAHSSHCEPELSALKQSRAYHELLPRLAQEVLKEERRVV